MNGGLSTEKLPHVQHMHGAVVMKQIGKGVFESAPTDCVELYKLFNMPHDDPSHSNQVMPAIAKSTSTAWLKCSRIERKFGKYLK